MWTRISSFVTGLADVLLRTEKQGEVPIALELADLLNDKKFETLIFQKYFKRLADCEYGSIRKEGESQKNEFNKNRGKRQQCHRRLLWHIVREDRDWYAFKEDCIL